MLAYILLALSTMLFSVTEVFLRMRRDIKLYVYILLAIYLFLFIGFRDCGFDYDNYAYYYRYLHSPFYHSNAQAFMIERGYAFLNYILPSYKAVLVFIAAITVINVSAFLYKYSPYPFFSIFLLLPVLVYGTFMGQFRQGLSISIVLWAFVSRRKIVSLLLILFASFFHISSLLSILFFIIPRKFVATKYYCFIFFIALCSNLFIGNLFSNNLLFFPAFISQKLDVYVNSEANIHYGLNLAMLLRVIIFFIFYKFKDVISRCENTPLFLNLYYMSLIIYLALGFLPQLGGRGSLYFYMIEVILVPVLICNIFSGKLRITFFVFFVVIALYRQYTFFNLWQQDYIPYKNRLFDSLLGL